VPESLIGRVRIGDTIAVAVDAVRVTVPGEVGEIAPASDPASRTTLVKIDMPANPAFRSGMFGRARIPTDAPPSLRVPGAAVLQRGQLEFVFVVREGVAHLRIVRTGRREGDRVEILSGLDEGEGVVVESASALVDGQPVVVP
jgi:RND family efflux transporter MFP subunit